MYGMNLIVPPRKFRRLRKLRLAARCWPQVAGRISPWCRGWFHSRSTTTMKGRTNERTNQTSAIHPEYVGCGGFPGSSYLLFNLGS